MGASCTTTCLIKNLGSSLQWRLVSTARLNTTHHVRQIPSVPVERLISFENNKDSRNFPAPAGRPQGVCQVVFLGEVLWRKNFFLMLMCANCLASLGTSLPINIFVGHIFATGACCIVGAQMEEAKSKICLSKRLLPKSFGERATRVPSF